jgi:hypothetical protein
MSHKICTTVIVEQRVVSKSAYFNTTKNREQNTLMRGCVCRRKACRDNMLQLPDARFSTRGVIPQSGSATYCDCNLNRDSVALHASQLVATGGP